MCLRPVYLRSVGATVPCGKCFECRVQRSKEWSFRICDELKDHEKNCMVTLTYDDAFLPADMAVKPREITLFMKRLRKAISPVQVRFFGCGEYGEKRLRPHYHIILFGYDFPDRYFFKFDRKGTALYRSPQLERLWTFGFSSVAVDLDLKAARYVAVYLQKPPLDGRHRPFVQMSRNPGIGANAIKPESLISDKIYVLGKYIKIPRYYLNQLEKQGFDILPVKARRLACARSIYLQNADDWKGYFKKRKYKIREIERIFGVTLDKNCMV